jgi:hypothetical protein
MDLTRIIPQRYFRNLLIVLLAALVIAAIAIVLGIAYILLTFHPVSSEQAAGLPPWVEKILLPIFQQYSKVVLSVICAVGFAFVCLVLFVGVNFIRADKVKLFGVEFQISEELSRVQRELEVQAELVAGLQENAREIQDLIEQQANVFRDSGVDKYYDFLDKMVETAAFVIRPQIRSVRAEIWLYRLSSDIMRIVAGYRVPQRTFRELVMKLDGPGFAPMVLRSGSPQTKENPEPGDEWTLDPKNTTRITSVMGQPIRIGSDAEWRAVLCFATDRNIAKFPNYKFSPAEDKDTLKLFSELISFALTLAIAIQIQDGSQKALIERIHERYT